MQRLLIATALLVGCGYESKSNEMVGQVKKLVEATPLICGDYTEVDVSLGVLRNGNGSISKEDVILVVERNADRDLLKQAADSGRPVRITYDVKRMVFCQPDHRVTGVELLADAGPT